MLKNLFVNKFSKPYQLTTYNPYYYHQPIQSTNQEEEFDYDESHKQKAKQKRKQKDKKKSKFKVYDNRHRWINWTF